MARSSTKNNVKKGGPGSWFGLALVLLLGVALGLGVLLWPGPATPGLQTAGSAGSTATAPASALALRPDPTAPPTRRPTATPTAKPTIGYAPVQPATASASLPTSSPAILAASPPPPPFSPTATAQANLPAMSPTVNLPTLPVGSQPPTANADRYGLIVTGLEKEPDPTASLNHALSLSNLGWWYQYGPGSPPVSVKTTRQIYLIRTWHGGAANGGFEAWLDFVRAGKFTRPSFWLIGNEPNVPGQDNTSPEVYAEALHRAAETIRAADPQATLIGPNVLNWSVTCQACPGFPSGLDWTNSMRAAYRARFGTEPPLDAWSLHAYDLNWNRLPLIDQGQDAAQIEALRRYLDAVPALTAKPIWLTEFGVVWGYDDLKWEQNGAGEWIAQPRGTYRQDLLEAYLRGSLDWLESNAGRLRLGRWFLFTSRGEAESFSPVFGGISLFDASSPQAHLTSFGRLYTERLKTTSKPTGRRPLEIS